MHNTLPYASLLTLSLTRGTVHPTVCLILLVYRLNLLSPPSASTAPIPHRDGQAELTWMAGLETTGLESHRLTSVLVLVDCCIPL